MRKDTVSSKPAAASVRFRPEMLKHFPTAAAAAWSPLIQGLPLQLGSFMVANGIPVPETELLQPRLHHWVGLRCLLRVAESRLSRFIYVVPTMGDSMPYQGPSSSCSWILKAQLQTTHTLSELQLAAASQLFSTQQWHCNDS